jgi:hemolysin III
MHDFFYERRRIMRDKISTMTHFIGAILSLIGLIYLIYKGTKIGNIPYLVGSLIFGISMVLLYSASTIYHWVRVKDKTLEIFRKIDHMMIFVLIAGTYTPICLVALGGVFGYTLLAIIWTIAIVGIVLKALWKDMPRKINTAIYISMGWFAIIALYHLTKSLPLYGLIFLILGGIAYTVGGVIYGGKFKIFNFKNFGFHEVFHLFVLAGSFFHYLMVATLI